MPFQTLRTLCYAVAALATVVSVRVQAGQPTSFEVASVRVSDPKTMVSHRVTDGRVDPVKIDLRQLLWMAFEIDPLCCRDRIPGAEPFGNVVVDIRATIPAEAGRKQVPEMLRSLLIQRFALRTHVEPRPTEGYELIAAAGGIRMKEVDPANEIEGVFSFGPAKVTSDFDRETVSGRVRTISTSRGIRTITERSMYDRTFTPRGTYLIDAVRITMTELASLLAANTGRPVLDRTNLSGLYSFSIELPRDEWMARTSASRGVTRRDGSVRNEPTGVSASRAVQQLGLQLRTRRISTDVIVIDHIERVPSEN